MKLKVITLSGTEVDSEIYEAVIPTTGGTIAVYQGHAPLLGEVAPGILKIRAKKGDQANERTEYGVYDGTVEVLHGTVQVLVDELDAPYEVNQPEAEAALKRAQEMQAKAKDAVSVAEAQSLIDRSEIRLQLAGLKKHSKRKY